MTCFLSLIMYRMLEKRLGQRFTREDTIAQLKGMRAIMKKTKIKS